MGSSVLTTYLVRLCALIALALGIYTLISAFYLWMSFHIHFPIRDTLRLMPLVQKVLEQGLLSTLASDWLAPHSGAHRITVIRLAMVIDHTWFGGQNHFIHFLAWLSLVTLFLIFFFAFRRSYRGENTLLMFISGLSLAFLLSHTQALIMIHPMGNTWYFAISASAASIYLIARNSGVPAWRDLLAAYLLAVVAAFSNFSGIFVFLLLPVLIGLRSLRMGISSAVIAVAFIFFYMQDISTGPTLDTVLQSDSPSELETRLSRLIGNVPRILSQVCLHLGSPLSIDYPWPATALVVMSFLLLGAGWAVLLRARLSLHAGNAWLETNIAIATLLLGVAIAICLGRSLILEPTSERYQSVVMFYWLCICGVMVGLALESGSGQTRWQPLSTTACLGILLLLTANPAYSVLNASKMAEKANRVSALTVMGVTENLDYRLLLIPRQPRALANLDPHFRKTNSGYWLDAVSKLDMGIPTDCKRVSIEMTPSDWPGIFVARGRIRDPGSQWYRQIPLSTGSGDVIGYLVRDFTSKVTTARMMSGKEDWWQGYVRLDKVPDGEVYLHYRRSLFSGTACRLTISRETSEPDMDAHPGNV